jgi:hypothetical protein
MTLLFLLQVFEIEIILSGVRRLPRSLISLRAAPIYELSYKRIGGIGGIAKGWSVIRRNRMDYLGSVELATSPSDILGPMDIPIE